MTLRYIPNIITIMRLLLVAPFLYYLLNENFQYAFYIFLVAGCSDGLDGFLARQFNWTSRFGAFVDPLADKLLMIGSFLVLAWLGTIPLWLFALLVSRDVVIMMGVGGLFYLFGMGEFEFEPTFISKLNTTIQIGFVFLLLFELAYRTISPALIHFVTACMIVTTVLSFIDYAWTWGQRAVIEAKTRQQHD